MSEKQISIFLQEIASIKTMEGNIKEMMARHEQYHEEFKKNVDVKLKEKEDSIEKIDDKFKDYVPIWVFTLALGILIASFVFLFNNVDSMGDKLIRIETLLNSSRIEK